MQLIELRAEMLTVSAHMMRLVETLRRTESELADSPSPAAADSATTPTAQPTGDWSAPAIIGLMVQVRKRLPYYVDGYLILEGVDERVRALVMQAIQECPYWDDLPGSATGGQQPQPRHSEQRQDNWPSVSSDPTLPREHSAPTPTPTCIDWSAVRRMAEDRLRSMWGESAMDSATMRTTMDAVMDAVEEAFKDQSPC